ncbi:MAG: HD domain-containing protein, partial [Candidatus Kapabacteria bacterium]|nr:HD domain-containing protein [Candidatus Kapabacteria bacterium]
MSPTSTLSISNPLLQELGSVARAKGVDVYVVGGYVRDALLKRERTDIDCTVVGDALAFAEAVASHFNTKAVLYERFRTALVPVGEYHLEFVGTRKEEYDGTSRKPTVTEGTLTDDLRRRDFTVNAMAASLTNGEMPGIIDLFGGLGDLAEGILRTPLDPAVTFSDDPLRMLRAARFAAQLGFSIQSDALQAMSSMSSRIAIISQERITAELLKILASPKPSIGLSILHECGLLHHFFPLLEQLSGVDLAHDKNRVYQHKDVFIHTLHVVDNVAAVCDNLWLRFAALMHDIAKPKTKRFSPGIGWSFHGHDEVGARMQKGIFQSLKLPMEHLPYVEMLVRLHHR